MQTSFFLSKYKSNFSRNIQLLSTWKHWKFPFWWDLIQAWNSFFFFSFIKQITVLLNILKIRLNLIHIVTGVRSVSSFLSYPNWNNEFCLAKTVLAQFRHVIPTLAILPGYLEMVQASKKVQLKWTGILESSAHIKLCMLTAGGAIPLN